MKMKMEVNVEEN